MTKKGEGRFQGKRILNDKGIKDEGYELKKRVKAKER